MRARLLVTDGINKNALSVIRNLGKEFEIDVLSHKPKWRSVCSASKYVRNNIRVHHPQDIQGYGEQIVSIVTKGDYDFFIPVGLNSYLASSLRRDEIKGSTNCLLPTWQVMQIAANKEMTVAFAQKAGIPVPETRILSAEPDLGDISSFPVVIKSSDSGGRFVRYCRNRQELLSNYSDLVRISRTRVIAQECVKGFGCGFYGVYKNGNLLDFFMHRRIKEFPVTGGPAAVAESYLDKDIFRYGKKIGDSLEWEGPIMAEFKKDPDSGKIHLIEVNPKLWGSLDLTIAAGVDVPRIIVRACRGEAAASSRGIELEDAHYDSLRFRWLFPDEFKTVMSQKRVRGLLELTRKGPGPEKTNMILSDPFPTAMQVMAGIIEGLQVAVNEKVRYPHGNKD